MNMGCFTLPGEAGYESLTLQMAERWGADMIRDSDGTELSPEITRAGYGIYSTVCVIRDHNQWADAHRDKLQQTFLCTPAVVAEGSELRIPVMESFFREQFQVNADALRFWQVWDRTEQRVLPSEDWRYDAASEEMVLSHAAPYHSYTVSFLAWRIWEEISMYNHTTNNWSSEHLLQIDPVYPEVQQYLLDWMERWCMQHPATSVVRFTSMFYNFVWIWGSNERRRHLFSDWASYDFTVSPLMLDAFEKRYGYALSAEDFVNGGKLRSTHVPPTPRKLDYMAFVHEFVVRFGRQLIEIVHRNGKQAYLFYDDSWVGTEPYSPHFKDFGFDGLIKCVFSGYEARLCAGVDVPVHELRLHPYLFPVGLGGAPTFTDGGNPALDARHYWNNVRRALLRQPVERIGLGGYLHLAEGYPDFCQAIDDILGEFRSIHSLHQKGAPYTLPCRVGVLHAWGSLRSWTLSGHFHETDGFDLIHINEALSGLPLDVRFISFEDVREGALENIDVLINAGPEGSAWSGGDVWADAGIVEAVTRWVWQGGAFIGVDEPSAVSGFDTELRLASVLGVELARGAARACHEGWQSVHHSVEGLVEKGTEFPEKEDVLLFSENVRVLAEKDGIPVLTEQQCGKGRGMYLSHFRLNNASARTLLNLILYACGEELDQSYITDNAQCECAFYPDSNTLAILNNSDEVQHVSVRTPNGRLSCELKPFELQFLQGK